MNSCYIHALHTWMLGNMPLRQIAECLNSIGFCADLSMYRTGNSSPEKVMQLPQNTGSRLGIEVPVCTAMFIGNNMNLSDGKISVRNEAIEFAKNCVEAAAYVGADRLLVSPSGITTAHRYSISREKDWATAVESLYEVGTYAQKYGIQLMIEPINRYRVALVHTVREAVRMADETGLKNIGVVPDIFHMCMEETEGVTKAIKSAGKRLLCLHIGSNTRNTPGMDTFEWMPILQTLKEMNYDGILSYEPVKLYFDETRVEKERDYRDDFLCELWQAKRFLNRLNEQLK